MIVPFRHLGNTRSLKKICTYDTEDLEYINAQTIDFDDHDHYDAFCLFQIFMLSALRQYGEFADEAKKMQFMIHYHRQCISEEFVTNEKQSLSLVTSIDIRKHGESLVKHILRE